MSRTFHSFSQLFPPCSDKENFPGTCGNVDKCDSAQSWKVLRDRLNLSTVSVPPPTSLTRIPASHVVSTD